MITVVAKLTVVDGKQADFEAAAAEMVKAVAANEQGRTLMYTLQKSNDDPTVYVFYEQYADQAAVDAHGKTEHMAAFGGKLRGVLAGRPEIQRFTPVASL